MSDFMERARAASHNPYSTPAGQNSALSRFDEDMRIAFMAGARWARDVLLADPTDGELLAADVHAAIDGEGDRDE